jgi:hypothetical protein
MSSELTPVRSAYPKNIYHFSRTAGLVTREMRGATLHIVDIVLSMHPVSHEKSDKWRSPTIFANRCLSELR